VREKYCWLIGGWRLLLEWCERKTLLTGAGAEQVVLGLHPGAAMNSFDTSTFQE